MDSVVEVTGLVRRYGDLTAVDNVSFSVRRGEIFGILGPNGAGKTTLLETIEGLQTPTTGSTSVLDLDSQRDAGEVKQRIGVQLQASAYFDFLTLREILDLFGSFYRRRVPAEALLGRVRLEEKADSLVKNLSGGQQQRFSIVASMVNDPEVLFLDEPTTGLDPQARHSLWELIRDIRADGKTIILTTHYMEEAETLCDRVAIMDSGRVVALDEPERLIEALDAPFHLRLRVGADPAPEQLRAGGVQAVAHDTGTGEYRLQVTSVAESLPALTARLSELGIEILHVGVERATLEDVFLSITGRELRD